MRRSRVDLVRIQVVSELLRQEHILGQETEQTHLGVGVDFI
jgi:hypothetical protein